ncbi:hypothetical protein [Trebonia sp.]|uniref:hypothetical protein n=1 Tax=Trebonia sp. TaxID=2767075 RepID=UPI0026087566|nr:hypothetical protein [Trebonia sp.]
MLTASLVIGGVLLLAMIAAAGYALVSLPKGARVPLHAGAPEHSVWLPKPAGLSVWLAVGALACGGLASLTASRVAAGWATSMRVTLLPAVMCVALAAELAAIISARRLAETAPPESRHRAGDGGPNRPPRGASAAPPRS